MIKNRKTIILILTVFALLAFGVIAARAFFYYPSDEVPLGEEVVQGLFDEEGNEISGDVGQSIEASVLPSQAEVEAISFMRLVIPKIDVNAKVLQVGVTSKGNMAAPSNYSDVGWYKYGTFPGETGSAVMAGHVDNGVALPAVFYNLEDLVIGDDIYLRTKEGKEMHFKVVGQDIYDFDSAPEEVFLEDDGKYLKLITCTGVRLKEFRTRAKRLVIKAELVE